MPTPRSALVLAAGLGTRLRPLTLARAKPAIPIAGEPLIRRILRWLASAGVIDIVINVHHLPETITAVVGDGSDLSVAVRYSWEQPEVLGSAGGPARALPLFDEDACFIVNGDTLTTVDLRELAAVHEASRGGVTLALAPNREPDRYGGVLVDAGGRVTGFVSRGSRTHSCHFVGVQAVDRQIFRSLPPDRPASTIGGLYDELLRAAPGILRGHVCGATFWDIGTASDYWTTSRAFIDGEAPDSTVGGRNVRLSPSARVTGSILWDDIEIGDHAVVDECIVTDGIRLPAGAAYHRMMLVRPRHGEGLIVAPRAGAAGATWTDRPWTS
jgi:NDP-sugar pyrophosphorylase family protein